MKGIEELKNPEMEVLRNGQEGKGGLKGRTCIMGLLTWKWDKGMFRLLRPPFHALLTIL